MVRLQERMDGLLLEAVAALSASTTVADSDNKEGKSRFFTSAGTGLVPALLRHNSLSLRKSASETFKER